MNTLKIRNKDKNTKNTLKYHKISTLDKISALDKINTVEI